MRPLSVGKVLVANTATTLYTVPTGYYAKCVLLHVTNSSPLKHITITWRDVSESVDVLLAFEYAITAKTSYDPITADQFFVMEEGDYISVISESGATMTITGTFEQIGLTRQ